MIWTAPQDSGGTPIAAIVGDLRGWGYIQVQIRGASSIFVGKSRDDLDRVPVAGLEIRSNDPPLEFRWYGQVWALGSVAGAQMDIEIQEGRYAVL